MKALSKITLIFLVILLLSIGLTACGPEEDDVGDTTNKTTDSQSNNEENKNDPPTNDPKPDDFVDDSNDDFKGGDIIIIG